MRILASRRLLGPNFHIDGPAAIAEVVFAADEDAGDAIALWSAAVRAALTGLGWPIEIVVRRHADERGRPAADRGPRSAPEGKHAMRSTYRVLGTLLAFGVVVQAASIAFALFQISKEIDDGAVIDKNYVESESGSAGLGFAIHAIAYDVLDPGAQDSPIVTCTRADLRDRVEALRGSLCCCSSWPSSQRCPAVCGSR